MQNAERRECPSRPVVPSSFCIHHSSFCISPLDILNTSLVTDSKEPSVTPSRRLYAFSLIELLVLLGVIAVLGTRLLMGINHLIINSNRQQTRLTFQNLQAMCSEWDAVNHR